LSRLRQHTSNDTHSKHWSTLFLSPVTLHRHTDGHRHHRHHHHACLPTHHLIQLTRHQPATSYQPLSTTHYHPPSDRPTHPGTTINHQSEHAADYSSPMSQFTNYSETLAHCQLFILVTCSSQRDAQHTLTCLQSRSSYPPCKAKQSKTNTERLNHRHSPPMSLPQPRSGASGRNDVAHVHDCRCGRRHFGGCGCGGGSCYSAYAHRVDSEQVHSQSRACYVLTKTWLVPTPLSTSTQPTSSLALTTRPHVLTKRLSDKFVCSRSSTGSVL
jgi:hypothetical protein